VQDSTPLYRILHRRHRSPAPVAAPLRLRADNLPALRVYRSSEAERSPTRERGLIHFALGVEWLRFRDCRFLSTRPSGSPRLGMKVEAPRNPRRLVQQLGDKRFSVGSGSRRSFPSGPSTILRPLSCAETMLGCIDACLILVFYFQPLCTYQQSHILYPIAVGRGSFLIYPIYPNQLIPTNVSGELGSFSNASLAKRVRRICFEYYFEASIRNHRRCTAAP
jgi:hypothetical protein